MLKKKSIIVMFLLRFLTWHIYPFHYVWSRLKSLNPDALKRLKNSWVNKIVAIPVIYLGFCIMFDVRFLRPYKDTLLEVLPMVLVVYSSIYFLVLLFTLRAEITKKMGIKLNPILTFIFCDLYLQFKVNRALKRI